MVDYQNGGLPKWWIIETVDYPVCKGLLSLFELGSQNVQHLIDSLFFEVGFLNEELT